MMIKVLLETNSYLVIDKPYGVVVNRAESVKGVMTIQDWVEEQDWYLKVKSSGSASKLYLERSGICHRIDKETSGCLLIAKSASTLNYFLGLFKNRLITKEYTALVHGRVEPDSGEIVLPIKRSIFEREKWHVHYDGKKAVSDWTVLERYVYPSANVRWKDSLSLLRIGLKTGRTHQIRVHFSFLGWPLFSDDKYLRGDQALSDRNLLKRHFLHSSLLSFLDEFGERKVVNSPLPVECQELLNNLRRG